MRCVLLLLALLLLLPSPASGQRVVGRVVDAVSGSGIPSAEVRLSHAGGGFTRAVSDSTGQFLVRTNTGAGLYRVTVQHLAYATSTAEVELGEQDQVEVLIQMAVTPMELPPLVVVARSRAPDPFLEEVGYYERRGGRYGVFIDPEQIERRRPLNTSDLFRGIGGVRVITLGGVRGNDIRITRGEDPNCPPRIYIDRVIVRRGGRQSDIDEQPLDALIQPVNVHAIEIFRSPSEMPVEFGGNYVTCGVVLIWTKRGADRR